MGRDLGQYLALISGSALSSVNTIKEKLKVKHLKNKDVPQASKTLHDFSESDSFTEYIYDTPDAKHSKWYERIERLRTIIVTSQCAQREWSLTIEHGRAVACVYAHEDTGKSQLDKFYSLAIRLIDYVLETKQQRKRFHKAVVTLFLSARKFLGNDFDNALYIARLASIPDFQAAGSENALVRAVKMKADAENRPIYAFSFTPCEAEFYQDEGFECAAEVLIGEDDATWNHPPAQVLLMVRARNSAALAEK